MGTSTFQKPEIFESNNSIINATNSFYTLSNQPRLVASILHSISYPHEDFSFRYYILEGKERLMVI